MFDDFVFLLVHGPLLLFLSNYDILAYSDVFYDYTVLDVLRILELLREAAS